MKEKDRVAPRAIAAAPPSREPRELNPLRTDMAKSSAPAALPPLRIKRPGIERVDIEDDVVIVTLESGRFQVPQASLSYRSPNSGPFVGETMVKPRAALHRSHYGIVLCVWNEVEDELLSSNEDIRFFVSKDGGRSFHPCERPDGLDELEFLDCTW